MDDPSGGEGDMRWSQALLLSTQEQARTGRPPASGLEYRVGHSDGGFDRLAFGFELQDQELPTTDPAQFNLSLALSQLF